MKGKNIIAIILALCILISFENVYCEEENFKDDTNTQVAVETTKIEENEEKVDEYTYNALKDLLNEISKKLISIDSKFNEARITEEYSRYPLIRLSIDSPYFGLFNITESRLNIKESTSIFDMARGYSIRSVVNTKNVLVEDIGLSDFVISSRKILISEEMTKKDANIVFEKLITYLNQVKHIEDYVIIQLNNVFSDYTSNSKEIVVNYLKNDIANVQKNTQSISDNLACGLLYKNSEQSDKIQKYNEILEKLNSVKEKYNSKIISEDELEKYVEYMFGVKSDISNLKSDVVTDENDELDVQSLINNSKNTTKEYLDYLYEILGNEYTDNESEESAFYANFSKYVSNVQKIAEELNDIEKIYIKSQVDIYEETSEQKDEFDYDKLTNILNDLFLRFLNSYNVALTQYIKINVVTIKSDDIKNIDLNDEIIYIYKDLDYDLKYISNNYNKNDLYSNINSINSLKTVIANIEKIINHEGELDI